MPIDLSARQLEVLRALEDGRSLVRLETGYFFLTPGLFDPAGRLSWNHDMKLVHGNTAKGLEARGLIRGVPCAGGTVYVKAEATR